MELISDHTATEQTDTTVLPPNYFQKLMEGDENFFLNRAAAISEKLTLMLEKSSPIDAEIVKQGNFEEKNLQPNDNLKITILNGPSGSGKSAYYIKYAQDNQLTYCDEIDVFTMRELTSLIFDLKNNKYVDESIIPVSFGLNNYLSRIFVKEIQQTQFESQKIFFVMVNI